MQEIVLLFDIDGTLVSTNGAGKRAMEAAFEAVLGWRGALEGVCLAGRTDPGIFREVCQGRGVAGDEIDGLRGDVHACYLERLDDELARGPRGRVYPGVEALLERLAEHAGEAAPGGDPARLHVGLLTGNIAGGAERKLVSYGLWHRFGFGAYGCDHEDRPSLYPIAMARAAALARRELGGARAVIIGDTPLDVGVAKAHGALVLAVATGRFGADELRAAGADLAVDDLSQTPAALAFLLGQAAAQPPAGHAPARRAGSGSG